MPETLNSKQQGENMEIVNGVCINTDKEQIESRDIHGIKMLLQSVNPSLAADIADILTEYVELRDTVQDLKDRFGDELDFDSYESEVSSMAEQSILDNPRDYGLCDKDDADTMESERDEIESEFESYKTDMQYALRKVADGFEKWLETLLTVSLVRNQSAGIAYVMTYDNEAELRDMFHATLKKFE